MKPAVLRILLAALLALLATAACECEDTGFHDTIPALDAYHVSDTQGEPGPADMVAIPDGDRLAVAFGMVDVGTLQHRYLYLQNTGSGPLQMVGFSMDPSTSTDYVIGCWENGRFVTDCAYSPSSPLSIEAGRYLLIQLLYAPADTGVDTGSFTMTFNVTIHQTVTVELSGEGVTPEIQACVSDCTGAQTDPTCAEASELCNDEVPRDQMILDFGDREMDSTTQRIVTVRNQGDLPLHISRVELTSPGMSHYSIDLDGSGLPGELSVGSETQFAVDFNPQWGGGHSDTILIGSSDVTEPEVLIKIAGQGVAPRICPDPLVLDFGAVQTGSTNVLPFNLESCGLETLYLMEVSMASGSSSDFTLLNPPSAGNMAPGALTEVQVQYAPQAAGSDSGGVNIYSDDQSADPVSGLTGTVVLMGEAVAQACDVQVTPFAVNFGTVPLGNSETLDVIVANVGSSTCTLFDVQISSNTPDDEFSLLQTPAANLDLQIGETATITVGYEPVYNQTNPGQDIGIMTLSVNDKDTDEVLVDLNAFGIPPDGDGPIAVCSVTPTAAVPYQIVTWNGASSYDSNGNTITEYRWEIFAFPPGSGATLLGMGPNRTTEVDFAGDYIARLVVVNDIGQTSGPCYATTTVEPTQDLWIEMSWTFSGDDMDLHMLAPGGSPRSLTDCYFGNCVPNALTGATLEWGTVGYAGDNPRLDRDNIPGTGPENINIADPVNGTYTVFVHDYPGSSLMVGNEVTVRVYLDGALQREYKKVIIGENEDWYVCEIDWPSMTITDL